MRDYIIGLSVAGLVLAVGYGGLEWLAGRPLIAQERQETPARTTDELLALLKNEKADVDDRIEAILDLGQSQDNRESVVSALVSLVGAKPNYRHAARIALADLGDPAVEHLEGYFSKPIEYDENKEISNAREILIDRAQGSFAVRALGDSCKVYLPQIQEMAKSEDRQLRKVGLFALNGMDLGAEESLDVVIECLDDSDFNNQCLACRIIERLGPKAAKAEPKLQELLKTGLPSVKGWAAICLGAIGPSPSKSDNAKALADILGNASPVVASRIIRGIAMMGADAKHVAPAIREKFKTRDRQVQAHAAVALWKIEGDERFMLDTLGEMLDTVGYEPDALEVIADEVGPSAKPLLPKILRHASAADSFTRERVALAIGKIGPNATSALPTLETFLNDDDPIVRRAARESIELVKAQPDKQ